MDVHVLLGRPCFQKYRPTVQHPCFTSTQYFTPSGKNTRAPRQAAEAAHLVPVAGAPGALTAHEVTSVQKVIIDLASEDQGPSKRAVYAEKNKQRVARYAALHGVSSAVKHFKAEFPKISKSTVCPWLTKYKSCRANSLSIGSKRGRPLSYRMNLIKKCR